ncbi:hypothetical protein BN1058_00355 [Paraliobacillus sp. PM-2]|nr:hypothetical protein BN1058_00355 [Paraliobacillus sp. PM-2]
MIMIKVVIINHSLKMEIIFRGFVKKREYFSQYLHKAESFLSKAEICGNVTNNAFSIRLLTNLD